MHEVLTSYLLLFEMGQKANLTDSRRHQLLKKRAAEAGGNWPLLVAFERDSVLNYVSSKTEQGALDQQHFTFQESTAIMEGLARGYGKWQHSECQAMKKDLMQLDADGTGRVSVSKFYSQPDTADYHFTESLDYLKTIGALDETGRGEARVRIANYMAGPSNCIASSSYYSVCCLNECEGLMNQLEAKVHAPTAAPEKLLNLVMNMSSDTVNAPRQLPKALQERLHEIASRNDGEVPLHGRLFAQWMHHAFPNECAHPEITEDAAVLTPSHWLDKTATVEASERKMLATAEPAKEATPGPPLERHQGAVRDNRPAWMTKGLGVGTQMFGEATGDLMKPGMTRADLEALEKKTSEGSGEPDPFAEVFNEAKNKNGNGGNSDAAGPGGLIIYGEKNAVQECREPAILLAYLFRWWPQNVQMLRGGIQAWIRSKGEVEVVT